MDAQERTLLLVLAIALAVCCWLVWPAPEAVLADSPKVGEHYTLRDDNPFRVENVEVLAVKGKYVQFARIPVTCCYDNMDIFRFNMRYRRASK